MAGRLTILIADYEAKFLSILELLLVSGENSAKVTFPSPPALGEVSMKLPTWRRGWLRTGLPKSKVLFGLRPSS